MKKPYPEKSMRNFVTVNKKSFLNPSDVKKEDFGNFDLLKITRTLTFALYKGTYFC